MLLEDDDDDDDEIQIIPHGDQASEETDIPEPPPRKFIPST
jgi:hypothetical protein